MLQDLKIKLSLHLNRECLEQAFILRRQGSGLLQLCTISNDGRERGTHLSERVINPGLLCDIKNLAHFHIGWCYQWTLCEYIRDNFIGQWPIVERMGRPVAPLKRKTDTREAAFGAVITELRVKKGLGYEDVAHKVGC